MDVMIENKFVPELSFAEFENERNTNSYKKYSFTDIFLFSSGKNIKQAEASPEFETPCVRYGELYHMYNEVIYKIINRTNLAKSELLFSKGNEILLPSAGEDPLDIGSASALTLKDVAIGRTINVLRPKSDNVYSQKYASYYINQKLRKQISKMARGVSISNVYNSDLKKLKIILPSLKEQQKIASFLSAVDEKLQQLTKKKELLEDYKKGVMQKIFSQDLRFKDDNGNNYTDWEEKKLGEALEYKSIRNKTKQIELVLSVSNKKGFISQQEQFDGHQVASKDTSNYKIVNKGEYAYNPSRINVGSIARLDDFKQGIVSPMYIIFRLKNNLHPIFFDALYSSHRFKYLIKIGCSGSVRDSLNFDEMEKFDIKLPSIAEQQKIANFLSSLDNKIELVRTQIENTKAFKKGLLQQMFV
jgi:type I restriction enzyme S subunit